MMGCMVVLGMKMGMEMDPVKRLCVCSYLGSALPTPHGEGARKGASNIARYTLPHLVNRDQRGHYNAVKTRTRKNLPSELGMSGHYWTGTRALNGLSTVQPLWPVNSVT